MKNSRIWLSITASGCSCHLQARSFRNRRAGGEEAFTLSEIQGEHLLSASFHHNFGGGREIDAPGCPLPQEDEGGRRLSAGYLLLLYLGDSNGTVALRPRMSF